jgi:signal transduction histidine kinase
MGTPVLSITADRLSRAEIFRTLSEADLIAIAQFCKEERGLENHAILEEGNPADTLFIVERGKLALEKKIQIGRHTTPRNATIGYVESGEIAGYSTLTEPHIYSTSAVCIENSRLIAIDGQKLREYLNTNPDAGLSVMKIVASIVGNRYRRAIGTLTYFLSIVSHELRSPLAAIENYLQLIHEGFAGDLNPKQERMVQRSILRILDLRALIGDVVDLARMRPEQIQADFEWFDPGEVGFESIEDARLAAAEKDIRIKVDPPNKFEPIVGARRRMRQVLTNLLNNAIKYTPQDSEVVFRARYQSDRLIFEIQDHGPGIPEDEIPHIFEDFYRASNVSETSGTGLGLSIAKKIVDAHEGDIFVTNIKDGEKVIGTRFTVDIPRDLTTPEMRRQKMMERV